MGKQSKLVKEVWLIIKKEIEQKMDRVKKTGEKTEKVGAKGRLE